MSGIFSIYMVTEPPALLRAIRPEAVLISVGADNRFGHPADETLRRIEKAGAAVFRTDLSGTITIRG